jgi:hypothetical protein
MQAIRWGAAATSFQLARSAAAVQDQGAEREGRRLNVACALSSLATRLRIDDNATRQGDCSVCLWYVKLCVKLQCVLLQLVGRSYFTPCQHTPVNASWLDIVDMCLETAQAPGGTQIVVTTKELAFDPNVQARFCPASTNLMPSRAELSQSPCPCRPAPLRFSAFSVSLRWLPPRHARHYGTAVGGSSRSFGHRSSLMLLLLEGHRIERYRPRARACSEFSPTILILLPC